MKKLFTFIAFLLIGYSTFAQEMQKDSLIELLNKETTDTGRIRNLIKLGNFYNYTLSLSDSAAFYLQEAIDLSKKINNSALEAQADYYLANNLYQSANFPQALILSLQNLKKIEQQNDGKNISFTIMKYPELLFYQTRLLVFIYSNIGDYKKQLEYVRKMQTIYNASLAKQTININYLFTIYFNLAGVYSNLKMPDSTFHYSSVLYNEVLKKGDTQWRALAINALAKCYEDQAQLDTAILLLHKCIPFAVQSNRLDLVVNSNLHIGNIFQKRGDKDSAFYYTHQALQQLSGMNRPADLLGTYKQLSQLYQDNKQYDSAYKYIQNFVILNDSIHDQTKINEAQNFAFNQTLVEQQVEQAKKEMRQQTENKIKLYALAGIIAFILLATFFLMRNLRNKRKANIILTDQKKEVQNNLNTLKDTQTQLIHAEKVASLGELTAGIAHEIQNPLNFVNNFSEVSNELIDELNVELDKGDINEAKAIAADVKQNLEKINHHGKRADAIVKGMLQHSQSSTGKKEPTDINALCDEYLRLSYHGLRAKDKSFNATMKTEFDSSLQKIKIIPQDIGRVVLNLLANAFYAVDEKKKSGVEDYEPTVTISTKKIIDKIEIKVNDNGNGIPQKIVDKIFQPFFTTKPTGQGTGLGLSLSYDIIKAHKGQITVHSVKAEGTTFTITLPQTSQTT